MHCQRALNRYDRKALLVVGTALLSLAIAILYIYSIASAGITTWPATGSGVSAVSAGSTHSCAVAGERAYCWGKNTDGQLGNGTNTDSQAAVAVNASGVLAGKTVTDIASGTGHTCAVANGAAYCWGRNNHGQLGRGSQTASNVPVAVDTSGVLAGKTVTDIAAGTDHSCAVANSAAYCWGNNTRGRLGDGTVASSTQPVAVNTSGVLAGKTVTDIAASDGHSCAIASGAAYCWGNGSNGRLGNSALSDSSSPVAVSTTGALAGKTVSSISAGHSHSCAIASGQAHCWGRNNEAQLGIGSASTGFASPQLVVTSANLTAGPNDSPFTIHSPTNATTVQSGPRPPQVQINQPTSSNNQAVYWDVPSSSTGSVRTYLMTPSAWSSGANSVIVFGNTWTLQGRIELGGSSSNPGQVRLRNAANGLVANSSNNTLATSTRYRVEATLTHSGTSGVLSVQFYLGESTTPVYSRSVTSDFGTTHNRIFFGKPYTSGTVMPTLQYDDLAYANNPVFIGAVGSSSSANVIRSWTGDGLEIGLPLDEPTVSLSAGYNHTCAVAGSKSYCWGDNTKMQVGGAGLTVLRPRLINTPSGGLSKISAGTGHSCTINASRAYCWGENAFGQIGDNTLVTATSPQTVKLMYPIASGSYRLYSPSTSITPGSPLADEAQAATLPGSGAAFRMRIGLTAADLSIAVGENNFKLRFAKKTAAACSQQATGFSDVTQSSAIAWHNAAPANGAGISQTASDPHLANSRQYQSYVESGASFTNTSTILANHYGIWDFSLKDNNADSGASYCLKITYVNDTGLESYAAYPEIITASGVPLLSFVNPDGSAATSPAFNMWSRNVLNTCQTTGGTLGSLSAPQLRVSQTGSIGNGWSISLAPTGGATALWTRGDNGAHYDFNDPSGSPAGCNSGSDGDGRAGQLKLILGNTTSVVPQNGCSTNGLSWNYPPAAFSSGVINAITLMTASSSAQANCYWNIFGTEMQQTIPAYQPAGQYSINLTATVVAQ